MRVQKVRDVWPLVGRENQRQQMPALLAGERSALVITGRVGTGKTRLARELLEMAERAGAWIVALSATRAAGEVPLGVFRPVLGVEAALPDRRDVVHASATQLHEMAAGRRLVILIDDAHLLDNESALLVQHLATRSAAFVVLTTRTGERAPGPIVSLWKNDATEQWHLHPLNIDDFDELLTKALGGPVDAAATARLARKSQGIILFFRELALGALENGALRLEDGLWRLKQPLDPSDRLIDLVEARLNQLSADERGFLEVVAFGETLGLDVLQSIGGAALVDSLERRGLIVSEMDGRRLEARLSLDVDAEVLRARTSASRRVAIAQLLLGQLNRTGARRRGDRSRLAKWALDAGTAEASDFLEAARKARWENDFVLANRLCRAAQQAGAGFASEILAVQLAGLQGEGERLQEMLSKLSVLAESDGDAVTLAIARFDDLVFHRGRIEDGLQLLDDVGASLRDDGWRDSLEAKRIAALAGLHGPRVGADLTEPLLEGATGPSLIWLGFTAAYALARTGRLERARSVAASSYEAHIALAEPFDSHPSIHMFSRANALDYEGRFDYSRILAIEQYRRALEEESVEAQAMFGWQLSKSVADRGFPLTAVKCSREAVAAFRQLGRPQQEQFALASLTLSFAIAGQPGDARRCLAQLDALSLPPSRYWSVDILHARAWAAIAAGDLLVGRSLLEDAATEADATGDLVGASTVLHTLARIGQADEVADVLLTLAPRIDGALGLARAEHASALASRQASRLDQVSVEFEGMSALLLAAEAAADSAVAWRRDGELRLSARAEQRASDLANRCENPTTPALQMVRVRSQLTRAESETALLAAAGRSNKEIAVTMGISVRTVENHLQHVYMKLGISGRYSLAESLQTGSWPSTADPHHRVR